MTNVALDYPCDLEDERPIEIVNGVEIPKMAARPEHQNVVLGMIRVFDQHLRKGPCRLYFDTFVHLTPKEKYCPDFLIVCDHSKVVPGKGVFGAPDLVAEVLSPRTSKRDKGHKKDVYEKLGVQEYWIVDIKSLSLEVYILNDEGRYELSNVYFATLTETELEDMRTTATFTFKTSIFEDLIIDVREIFEDLL
ncbi:MAG: Uma2 family endonuclease [Defluviitaleaceae bacterium]|nr:Uma2 family endonuclease [Defluviitaleaceae bacterium]